MPTMTGTRPSTHSMVRRISALRSSKLEIGVFLRLDAGGDHHGGAAVVDDVIDLALERGLVDREFGRERRQRRDDEAGFFGWHFHAALPVGTAGDASNATR